MTRIALANLPFPSSREGSVRAAIEAITDARGHGAAVICFPECYLPGYRAWNDEVAPPDQAFLERAWNEIAEVSGKAGITTVLGTERIVDGKLRISVLVIDRDGSIVGFQDKVQLDPSEDETYSPASGRRVFTADELTFGVAICHEGFRYPETFRFAAREGAQLVFHPHYHKWMPGDHKPTTYGEAANTFHEKALMCRAAENTCFVATVNYASEHSPTTSAVINPDGTVLSYQPYGVAGVHYADLDLSQATRLLANRFKPLGLEAIVS